MLSQEEHILREALGRGYLDEATLAQARAEAARRGEPLLPFLAAHCLSAEQVTSLRTAATESGRLRLQPQAGQAAQGSPLPQPGDRVGRYVLERLLGKGGMGEVYAARDAELGRPVAIKLVLPSLVSDTEIAERFRREAEALGAVRHPNVVGVHEAGAHALPNGPVVPYLVLEYVEGESLKQRLERDGPFEPRSAAELLQALVSAVELAHAQGVLHRDLKPDNVLLSRDGTPKLADFGLARLLDREALTKTGEILGTPAYMAPEQAAGERERFGPPTDIYGLGGVLYALLTGQAPFQSEGGNLAVMKRVLFDPPRAPSEVLPKLDAGELETICQICLEKEPEDRYASAAALAADVTRWTRGESIQARRPTRRQRVRRWARRHRLPAGLIALATLALLGAGGFAIFRQITQQAQKQATVQADPLEAARAALEAGRYQKAITLLSKLEGLDEHGKALLLEAHTQHARVSSKAKEWTAAAAGFAAALELRPSVRAHLGRAHALDQLLRLEEADPHYRAAARLLQEEQSTDLHAAAARDLRRARLLRRGLDVAGAKQACQAVVQALQGQDSRQARDQRYEARLIQARLEIEHGDFNLARKRLEEAERVRNDDYRVYLLRGIAFRERSSAWVVKGEGFDKARTLCPDSEATRVQLQKIIQLLGQPRTFSAASKALDGLEGSELGLYHAVRAYRLLAVSPPIQALYLRIASDGSLVNATRRERKAAAPILKRAEVAVRKALALRPRAFQAWFCYAAVLLYRGDTSAALRACDQALRLHSCSAGTWFYRACLRLKADPADAERSLDRALKLKPNNFMAHWLRMEVRLKRGNLPGAREEAQVLLPFLRMWIANLGQGLIGKAKIDHFVIDRAALAIQRLIELNLKPQARLLLDLLDRKLKLLRALTPAGRKRLMELRAKLQ